MASVLSCTVASTQARARVPSALEAWLSLLMMPSLSQTVCPNPV